MQQLDLFPDLPRGIHQRDTLSGFEYGAARIDRVNSNLETGEVTLGLMTPKTEPGAMQIRINDAGHIRIFYGGMEWLPHA